MPVHPNTLALELSQREGSVAMMNSSGQIESTNICCNKRDDDNIFPAIDELKNKLQMSASEVELVVVNIGPGGFTGLRTSVAIAKMISLVNHASIVPVESAIVCAEHSGIGDGPFFVVSSVKGEHFWLSKVQQTASGWECESAISTTESLGSILGDIQAVFADEFIPEEAHSLLMRNEIPIYPLVLSATALLRIGVKLFKDGCSVHPSELLPMYPREPEAVRRWKAKDSTK